MGLTRSSRHSLPLGASVGGDDGLASGLELEGAGAGVDVGAMDWKMWMGSASKNSWATMKGTLSSSVV